MEFCPKCRSILFYSGKRAFCKKCGYEKEAENYSIVIKEKRKKEEIPIIEEVNIRVLPTTRAVCPECGNNEAYWWLRQLRAADEPEVRFFRCTKCGKTWREYS
ncbi:MAG: transcription factor S [Archaeoglobaceae archaeon]|nr:transcription factor S [Archaeoglobaceae archaeon]